MSARPEQVFTGENVSAWPYDRHEIGSIALHLAGNRSDATLTVTWYISPEKARRIAAELVAGADASEAAAPAVSP